jgi:hypothetical protein
MTEHNHRRGTKAHSRHNDSGVPVRYCRFAQRQAHSERRQLVRKLLTVGREDDIPGNTPRHIRWDYW